MSDSQLPIRPVRTPYTAKNSNSEPWVAKRSTINLDIISQVRQALEQICRHGDASGAKPGLINPVPKTEARLSHSKKITKCMSYKFKMGC